MALSLGSLPMAAFVGDQFAAIYIGGTRVPTVPGRPEIAGLVAEVVGDTTYIDTPDGPDDGGSEITGLAWYIDGALTTPATDFGSYVTFAGDKSAQAVQVAAVNAIGAGVRSAPYQF